MNQRPAASGVQAHQPLVPGSAVPLAYYAVAHAAFAAALIALVVDPSLPAGSFYQPRMIALVHLLTVGWLTSSILGSLYIVAPLTLGVPMPPARADWIAFGMFATGASGIVSHFWINTYDSMAWSAMLVAGPAIGVGVRTIRRLSPKIASAVQWHVRLAFFNLTAAAALGILLGFARSRGFLSLPPLASVFAHAHLAAIGWVMMMVIGLSYRLIPMILPSAMPPGSAAAWSAVLLQCGLALLTMQLFFESAHLWIGAVTIAAGILAFLSRVWWMLRHSVPRPPALPARDWSVWQVRLALLWLVVALSMGLLLAFGAPGFDRLQLMWMYGTAGLVGFLAQMVAGMQGRLVPLYAWYRAYAAGGGPPPQSSHTLPSAPFARAIFACWAVSVPMFAWGLPHENVLLIRAAALTLLSGIVSGAVYLAYMIRRASNPPAI